MLYNNLSGYLRRKYGRRLKKICLDGGFTCPNRDGKCGTGGCIFCGERGAGEHINPTLSINEQVTGALKNAKDDELFIAYFQNFTNTYAEPEILKERYDAALIDDRIKILSVGTRPDCIDEQVCRLLSEYQKTREVWVELGLQTANDLTAKIINRGYGREVFERAMKLLSEYGIPTVVHMIIGLPGESLEDVKSSTEYLSRFELFGLKIHSIYVMKNTVLAKMHEEKRYTPPTLSQYVESCVYMLTHVSDKVIIHRLTGDCPKDELIAPSWNADKNRVIGEICSTMEKDGLCQGCFFP